MKDIFFLTFLFFYSYYFNSWTVHLKSSVIDTQWMDSSDEGSREMAHYFWVKVCDGVSPNWRRWGYGLGDIGRVKEFQSTTA